MDWKDVVGVIEMVLSGLFMIVSVRLMSFVDSYTGPTVFGSRALADKLDTYRYRSLGFFRGTPYSYSPLLRVAVVLLVLAILFLLHGVYLLAPLLEH